MLFDGRSTEQKLEEAKRLLQEHGYVVSDCRIDKHGVNSPFKLVRFFYSVMAKYMPPGRVNYAGVPERDLRIAKEFINSNINRGLSKEAAIDFSCQLIEILFRYKALVGLKTPITSMIVLSQGESFSWITEKLIEIYNKDHVRMQEEENIRWFEGLYRQQEYKVDEKKVKDAIVSNEKAVKTYGEEKDQ